MKTTILALALMVCGSVAFAHDTVVIVTPSQQQPVCTNGNCPRVAAPSTTCRDGKCKLYSVDEQFRESTRPRILGGRVVRQTNRTVVKPVR